jgi:stringent starvation protein B
MAMTSSRPYLIRALYEWIVDNEFTPHIAVDAHVSNVQVPQQYVNKDGQIVLNIAPHAVVGLEMGNKAVSFSARFGGIPTQIYVPCQAILGIYARENGQGMMFEHEPNTDPDPEPPTPKKDKKPEGDPRPSLRVVK